MMKRLRNRQRDQRGVTLAEAIITVFVLSLVLLAFYSSFSSAQKTSGQLDAKLEHIGEAQKLIRVTTKDIRTVTPLIENGSPFPSSTTAYYPNERELYFYARLDQGYLAGPATTIGNPELVHLYIDSSNPKLPTLREETQEADIPNTSPPTYGTGTPVASGSPGVQPKKLRLIGTYIYNTTTEPIFTYYDVNGTQLGSLVGAPTGPWSFQDWVGPLSLTDQPKVRSIGIRLRVKKSTALGVKPTTVETIVRLPNVIYGVAPGT